MSLENIPFDRLMVGATLNLLSQALSRRVVEAMHAQGFTDFRQAYNPVFQWCKPEGSRLSELADMSGVTKSAMTQLVDVLVRLGYVERVPDPHDGRATLIRRTERGWAVNRVAGQTVETIQQEWTSELGPDTFAILLQALRHLTRITYSSATGRRSEG